jgi:hypothetical protein
VERGTFSHRHAVVKVEDSEEEFIHLKQSRRDSAAADLQLTAQRIRGAPLRVRLALTNPNTLTIWEAHFGDFVNGAQIILTSTCAAPRRSGTRERPGGAAAPRLRGPGVPSTAAHAWSASCRAAPMTHAGGELHHSRELHSTCCVASWRGTPQAAGGLHAEEPVSATPSV